MNPILVRLVELIFNEHLSFFDSGPVMLVCRHPNFIVLKAHAFPAVMLLFMHFH